jgi:DNA modification methylase
MESPQKTNPRERGCKADLSEGFARISADELKCNTKPPVSAACSGNETAQATVVGNQRLALEYHPTSALKLDPENPRLHSEKQIRQIASSIEAFGFNVPVLVDAQLRVVAGHGRVQACRLLGIGEVPTIRLEHLREAQARAFMIADNRLTENAAWDDRLLAEQLKALSEVELDFSLEATGFEMGEIDVMIEGLSPATDGEQDPADEFPDETNKIQVSRLSDLWQLDKHRVLCADATELSSFVELMAGQKAALAFSDPPYNVRIHGHATGLGKTHHAEFPMASGEMTEAEFTDFLTSALTRLASASIDGSIHFICMDWRHMAELLGAGRQAYGELKNLCVWAKDNAGMGSLYRSQHELIFVFKNGNGSHRNNVQLGQFGRYRTNVWQYPGVNSFSRSTDEGNLLAMHPTVKPVAMVADAIMDCSARGDIVLDGFLGSGTTVIAAERTGRVCYGLELDPAYVDTIVRRWQAFTGKSAIHLQSGRTFNEIEQEIDNG